MSFADDKYKNTRGMYAEHLTGEIFATLDDIISDDIDENVFLNAQERIRKIIEREYVEKKDQCTEPPKYSTRARKRV